MLAMGWSGLPPISRSNISCLLQGLSLCQYNKSFLINGLVEISGCDKLEFWAFHEFFRTPAEFRGP
jgi:hypothetical protein